MWSKEIEKINNHFTYTVYINTYNLLFDYSSGLTFEGSIASHDYFEISLC